MQITKFKVGNNASTNNRFIKSHRLDPFSNHGFQSMGSNKKNN